jgi:hypothetical protein
MQRGLWAERGCAALLTLKPGVTIPVVCISNGSFHMLNLFFGQAHSALVILIAVHLSSNH